MIVLTNIFGTFLQPIAKHRLATLDMLTGVLGCVCFGADRFPTPSGSPSLRPPFGGRRTGRSMSDGAYIFSHFRC